MKENKFEENPNPEAKIAFVMWTPFHYWVYKNIAKHLPESEFVICDTWFNNKFERGDAHIADAAAFLSEKKVYSRVLPELDDKTIIENFFSKYEVIVSVLLMPPLDSLSFDDWFSKKKSILISYGAGKDLNTFAPWVARFDISLVDGPRTHEYHKLLTESRPVGIPKYDDWFKNTIDPHAIESVKSRIDPSKKTILYLPTHSGISSLRQFSDEVIALSKIYNVILKLHHLNRLTETEFVDKFFRANIPVFEAHDDVLPLFAVSDAVISDSSSALFETLLVDKPLVILDTTNNKEIFEAQMSGQEFNGYWYSGGLTYKKSIEEKIKRPEDAVGIIARKGDNLARATEDAIQNSPNFKKNRDILRKELFLYTDGGCGERAAAVIRDFLAREKPAPPLLGQAIRAYFTSLQKNYRFQMQKILKENTENFKLIENQKKIISALNTSDSMLTKIKKEKNIFKKTALILRYVLS